MKTPNPRKMALRKNEVATTIGVSVGTLDNWLRTGEAPPHFRKDRVLLFPVRELESWLSRQCDISEEHPRDPI